MKCKSRTFLQAVRFSLPVELKSSVECQSHGIQTFDIPKPPSVVLLDWIRMNILMLDTRNVEQTKDVRMYT